MSAPTAPTIDDFIAFLGNSEELLAALTMATHRFYYDHCFSSYNERPFESEGVEFVNELYNILWAKAPGWRDTMQKAIKRYMVSDASVKWLPIFCRPDIIDTVASDAGEKFERRLNILSHTTVHNESEFHEETHPEQPA